MGRSVPFDTVCVMRIRRADADDAEQIAAIHVQSWQAAYVGLLPQATLDALDAAARVPHWRAEIEASDWPRRGIFVAEDDGLLGFASLCACRADVPDAASIGELSSVYLLPQAWGRGVGRALITRTLETLSTARYESAMLWVLQDNTRAIAFYEALEWTANGAVQDRNVAGTPVREVGYTHSLE
jgi:ribosomal protein S18 acetylase RimI-like enzyme